MDLHALRILMLSIVVIARNERISAEQRLLMIEGAAQAVLGALDDQLGEQTLASKALLRGRDSAPVPGV